MALQSTANTANPLKFSEIKTEFAATANNLRAYLKGAGIVDSNDTAPNVPSTGTIKILDFLGAARVDLVVNLPQYNAGLGFDVVLFASASQVGFGFPSWAKCQIALYANGSGFYRQSNANSGDTDYNFTWLTTGSASDVYAWLDTVNGDAPTTGSSAVATSLQMNVNRGWEWYIEVADGGYIQYLAGDTTLRLKNSSNTDLDTVTVSFYSSADGGGGPSP